jgi:hypothetical protein
MQEDTMNPNTFRLAEFIYEERLAEAAQARQRYSVSSFLADRLRAALSKRLIAWGERLSAPAMPTKEHA